MSCELKKDCVRTGRKLKETSFEQKIDMDITLPDYCADIKKILKCSVEPGVHTVSRSGERVNAKGTGTVRVVYLAEGDKIDVYEKNCDLSSTASFKDITPETAITAFAAVDFVNCRAVSQRKIAVNASVSTIFYCYVAKEESYAMKNEKDNIQAKTEKISCENNLGFFEKTFDMAETVALNSEHPTVGKIIDCSSRILNVSHKLSQGKLLIKGDAVTDIRYLTDDGKNTIHAFSHSMPISQIIDLRQVPDDALCKIRLRVCQRLCSCKADSSGSNRLVDIALRVSAFIEGFEKKELEVITDCYCTAYEIKESFEKPDFLCPIREINEPGQIKGELELSSEAKEICFVSCTGISYDIKCTEDKAKFDCSALMFIMYIDENGVPCCQEKNLDFEFDYAIVKKCGEPFGSFSIESAGVTLNSFSKDKAELTLDFNISGNVYGNYDGKILRSLTVFDDKPLKNGEAALTLYFADKGEQLWNIAREHNSSVELIMKENGIKGQTVAEKSMLLIPCV